MAKIEKLTSEEQALLPLVRAEYLKLGLATGPANRDAAQAAIADAYHIAGLEPPKIWIWLGSPRAGCIGAHFLTNLPISRAQVGAQVRDQVGAQVRDQVGDQVRAQVRAQVWNQVWDQVRAQVRDQVGDQVRAQVWNQVWDQVGAQVWDQVGDQVRAQVGDQVRDQVRAQVGAQVGDQVRAQVGDQVWNQVWDQVGAQVGDQVGDQVRAQVGDQVRDQVRAQVRAQVWDQVGAQVGDQVRAQVGDQVWNQVWDQVGAQVWAQVGNQVGDQVNRAGYGQHDSGWLAFYDVFRRMKRVQGPEKLHPLMRLATAAGWWWPFAGACIITERPVELHRDEAGRLHHDMGPALAYPDGFAIHAWHGIRIERWLIQEKHRITPDLIEAEANTELRRVMLEIHGFDRYITERGAKLISEDTALGLPRSLFEISLGDEPIRVLRVLNGTVEPDGRQRQFHLGVPLDCATPHDAVAWTYGRPAHLYKEGVRT